MNKIKKIISKKNKTKIVSLTSYSKNVASILDNYCDIILVGDSLGSVLYNYKSTREVTLNTMIEHSKSVRMGIKKSLMIVDMPHNTYRNPKEALKNAKLIMKKTKCDGVKLEGGKKIINTIKTLVKNNIPVIFYFSGTHEDYHQPTDTAEKIRYDLLTKRTRLIFHTAWEIANMDERIEVDQN